MKHTDSRTPVTLAEAMDRVPGLTQLRLEQLSGLDRTRISKLRTKPSPRMPHDTYLKLDGALRHLGCLQPSERLVFEQPATDPPAQDEACAS